MKRHDNPRVLIDRIPYAEGNLGEESILASLIQDLNTCGVSDISVLSNQPVRTKERHGGKIQVIHDRPLNWLLLPLKIIRSDLLIWGGGHMLQDRSSQLYVPYVVKTLVLAKILNKSRLIYAPGLGPVVKRLGKALSRIALGGSRGVTVRDETSAEFMRSIGLNNTFTVTADPAFSLKTPFDRQSPSGSGNIPLIGFASRRLFYRRGSWFPVSWQLASERQDNPRFDRFLQEAAAALDLLIEKKGVRVRLLPMDLGPNPRDDLICYRLRSYMVNYGAAEVQDDDPPLDEFVRRLSELDLLVSARLHGIILGLRFGLPFIGIDSDGKIQQMADSIGYGKHVLKDGDFEKDRFFDLAVRMLNERSELRRDLIRHGEVMRHRAESNREALQQCLEGMIK